MMVHRFSHQRDARHVAERRDEILAREFLVQLSIGDVPALGFGKQRGNLGVGSFFAGMA